MNEHILIVLSGPSGVGKGTVAKELLRASEGTIVPSVSATTRAPRTGEENGREYFFLSREEFTEKLNGGGFLEHSEHFGNLYGTPLSYVEQQLRSRDVLLEIDVNGALLVRLARKDAVLVFLAPPSPNELLARLRGRGTESEEEIARRAGRAAFELGKAHEYDYIVVNDRVEDAVRRIGAILDAERCKTARKKEYLEKIMEEFEQ